jgi:hypothetical protein
MSTKKKEIQIFFGDHVIAGLLILADRIWSFKSQDPVFLANFPTGTLYSFQSFDDTGPNLRYRVLQQAINEQVADFFEASA